MLKLLSAFSRRHQQKRANECGGGPKTRSNTPLEKQWRGTLFRHSTLQRWQERTTQVAEQQRRTPAAGWHSQCSNNEPRQSCGISGRENLTVFILNRHTAREGLLRNTSGTSSLRLPSNARFTVSFLYHSCEDFFRPSGRARMSSQGRHSEGRAGGSKDGYCGHTPTSLPRNTNNVGTDISVPRPQASVCCHL